jgi:hypothetical protein
MTTPQTNTFPTLLKPIKPFVIVGYGAYVPRYRIAAKEIARLWASSKCGGLPIKEKVVSDLDEDVLTSSIEAARNAMLRVQINPAELRAIATEEFQRGHISLRPRLNGLADDSTAEMTDKVAAQLVEEQPVNAARVKEIIMCLEKLIT